MPCIQLDMESLYLRGSQIRGLLSLLSRDPRGPAWSALPAQGRNIVFAAHDGSPEGEYSRWRFPTCVDGIRGNYYERWAPVPRSSALVYLDRAYLTIYRRKGVFEEAELLALHCDPDESSGRRAVYKRGPHLHVVAAESPIRSAHIALAITHIHEVLQDSDTLMDALQKCIRMIREEVLERYAES